MSDWPPAPSVYGTVGVHNSLAMTSGVGDHSLMVGATSTTAAAWPAANRALYIPFCVEQTVTAFKMAFIVGASAGNYDVGLYDENGNRLVSLGSTAVPAAGLAVADITDTVLRPGTYFMAMNCSTVTTLTIQAMQTGMSIASLTTCGMQQEAVGAVTLPDPATFANIASIYVPSLSVAVRSTI